MRLLAADSAHILTESCLFLGIEYANIAIVLKASGKIAQAHI